MAADSLQRHLLSNDQQASWIKQIQCRSFQVKHRGTLLSVTVAPWQQYNSSWVYLNLCWMAPQQRTHWSTKIWQYLARVGSWDAAQSGYFRQVIEWHSFTPSFKDKPLRRKHDWPCLNWHQIVCWQYQYLPSKCSKNDRTNQEWI